MEGGEELLSSTSSTGSDKVKFFCSHGGKILPRPIDGSLKYVGGETRVISVNRSITFSELMKKINTIFDGEYVLKYQIANEDLDSLVSVKSDEDFRHMLDEYDRLEQEGTLKLRTFIFSIKPTTPEIQNPFSVLGPHAQDQRFIDAINGIIRPINYNPKKFQNTSRIKSLSPSPTGGSSPQSGSPLSSMQQDNSLYYGLQNRLARMHRVHSSPSLCSLGGPQNSIPIPRNSHVYQPSMCNNCPSQPHNYYYNGYLHPSVVQVDDQVHIRQGNQSPTQCQDTYYQNHHGHKTPYNIRDYYVHASSQPLMARGEPIDDPFNYGITTGPKSYHYPFLRDYPGSGGHTRWGHLEKFESPSLRDS